MIDTSVSIKTLRLSSCLMTQQMSTVSKSIQSPRRDISQAELSSIQISEHAALSSCIQISEHATSPVFRFQSMTYQYGATSQLKMDLTAASMHWIAGSALVRSTVQPAPSLITGTGSNEIKLGLHHC